MQWSPFAALSQTITTTKTFFREVQKLFHILLYVCSAVYCQAYARKLLLLQKIVNVKNDIAVATQNSKTADLLSIVFKANIINFFKTTLNLNYGAVCYTQ